MYGVLNVLQKILNSFLAFANTGLHMLMLLSCNAVSAVATSAVSVNAKQIYAFMSIYR